MISPVINPLDSPWFIRHSRSTRGAQRLFCFPYAGGNAHIFRAWADLLPPSIEVVGVQAPGKGSRLLEQPCSHLSELIERILPVLLPALQDKPFSFFGHSNGALFAFELCCSLQARGLPLPEQLLISASPAPWTRRIERPYSSMPDAEFRNVLQELNGTPAEVLADPELFQLVLPGLRADFALAENYRYEHARKLAVATSVFWGRHDRIEEEQIQAWQDEVEDPLQFDCIPGGHFFIHSHLELLTGLIGRRLVGGAARVRAQACATS